MSNNIQSIKGMHDCLPNEVIQWYKIECLFRKILFNYSYNEIRLPILEKTELFKRTIGDMTDVIKKEMYSFNDKKNNSITLRPEGTASCIRSVIQNGLLHHKKQKLWYYGPMFRYERPQKGRYRQFHQLGIEVFGFKEPEIELELILLINRCWKILNISSLLTLEINLIGSIESRLKYQEILKKFLIRNKKFLDSDCLNKLYKNPLRILDTKNTIIQKLLLRAPIIMDYVDQKSRLNFNKLCTFMDFFNIKYIINHHLIRGLDYYNNTVFEWKTNSLGSQNTICAGGRYDILVKKLGGLSTPAAGLAIGMDRLLLLINSISDIYKNNLAIDIYIFFDVENIILSAFLLSEEIRNILPNIKILVELKSIHFKKIFKNIKKYSSHIVLFLDSEIIKNNLIYIYDVKKNIKKYVSRLEIINIINSIFCSS